MMLLHQDSFMTTPRTSLSQSISQLSSIIVDCKKKQKKNKNRSDSSGVFNVSKLRTDSRSTRDVKMTTKKATKKKKKEDQLQTETRFCGRRDCSSSTSFDENNFRFQPFWLPGCARVAHVDHAPTSVEKEIQFNFNPSNRKEIHHRPIAEKIYTSTRQRRKRTRAQ